MLKVFAILFISLLSFIPLPCSAQGIEESIEIFRKLKVNTKLPSSENLTVGEAVAAVCRESKLDIDYPEKFDKLHWDRSLLRKDVYERIMPTYSCLCLLFPEDDDYMLRVKDHRLSIVKQSEIQGTEYAEIHSLRGLDSKIREQWKETVQLIVAPNEWLKNGGACKIWMLEEEAIIQCKGQMHGQIMNLTEVMSMIRVQDD